jgi:hypothetical protein
MADPKRFKRWAPAPCDLAGLTLLRARDLISNCFFEAQKETIALAKEQLGLPASDDEIRHSAVGALRMAFQKTGGDFEAPTRNSLEKAVESLAQLSRAFGTPAEIIDYHRKLIEDILAKL